MGEATASAKGLAGARGKKTAAPAAAAASASASSVSPMAEPLSCTLCRSRKLKCCRTKPVCARCVKADAECVYPESRRKPATKRRNVKELESRLAQVEDLLKDAAASKTAAGGDQSEETSPESGDQVDFLDLDLGNGLASFSEPGTDAFAEGVQGLDQTFPGADLMGMGMFESLPPFDVIEDLHSVYFRVQNYFLPLVHPGRYLQAFHSAAHMRPPMCLQYAIWAFAAVGHAKYSCFHDVFYRRARHYLESDEIKGVGEHFITVAHAQAWSIVSNYEARNMVFPRAAMSCARAVRLCHILGLHLLDGEEESKLAPKFGPKTAPALLPPKSWQELEERRRTFWAAFVVDCHASIATGWPTAIHHKRITTNLPSSNETFVNGTPEKSRPLPQLYKGTDYSSFAGMIGTCHVLNQLLAHVHHESGDDHPDDLQHGEFWRRHRDLDNTLSNAFLFMPERLRLPRHTRSPEAVHSNLIMHASIICLHMAAYDRAAVFSLPVSMLRDSRARLVAAAEEIVAIMRLCAHTNMTHDDPLVALALYCSFTVFILLVKESNSGKASATNGPEASKEPDPSVRSNLDFLVGCIIAIGEAHTVTRAFLRQVAMDLHMTGITTSAALGVPVYGPSFCHQGVPLLARTQVKQWFQKNGAELPHPGKKACPRNPSWSEGGHGHGEQCTTAMAASAAVAATISGILQNHTNMSNLASATTTAAATAEAAVSDGRIPLVDEYHDQTRKRRRMDAASPSTGQMNLPHRTGGAAGGSGGGNFFGDGFFPPLGMPSATTGTPDFAPSTSGTALANNAKGSRTPSTSSSVVTPVLAGSKPDGDGGGGGGGKVRGSFLATDPSGADSFIFDLIDMEEGGGLLASNSTGSNSPQQRQPVPARSNDDGFGHDFESAPANWAFF